MPLQPGAAAPPIPGIELGEEPRLLFFYKVTCPVCQMAAPKIGAMAGAYPGRTAGIGQDPPDRLREFSREHGLAFPSLADTAPYAISDGYGVRVVPTLFLVDAGGTVAGVAESWDRDGFNRLSRALAEATGADFTPVSEPGDGLPAFRPG
jgi:peroxiredoxin